jgi:hypothetical protein
MIAGTRATIEQLHDDVATPQTVALLVLTHWSTRLSIQSRSGKLLV